MTTKDSGVAFDRRYFIRKFEVLRDTKLREQSLLRDSFKKCDHTPGDECDRAQEEVDLGCIQHRQDVLKEDLTRIGLVLTKLENGWSGDCIDCGTSVVLRLEKGIPTRRCCMCKDNLEKKAMKKGIPFGLVHAF